MKTLSSFILTLLFLIIIKSEAQKPKLFFTAGYGQSTSSGYKSWPFAMSANNKGLRIFHKPGFFVGTGLDNGKSYIEAIYVNNRMFTDTNSSYINLAFSPKDNPKKEVFLNYVQLSFLRKKNISKRLSFRYGLTGNINLYTFTTYKALDGFGELYKLKTKGLTLDEGNSDFLDLSSVKKNINMVPVTLNFATRLNYYFENINIFCAYNRGLTKAVYDPSYTSLKFYYSNLSTGISFQIKYNK